MAVRLYHIATEMNLRGSELLTLLAERGLRIPSVMTILADEDASNARAVAAGKVEVKKRPEPGELQIELPPPVVPAPARPIRPATPQRARPGRPATPQRGPVPRRGIKIFKQKEARERRAADRQKAEDIFAGRVVPITVPIALKEFSQHIGIKTNQLLLHLMKNGIMANPNTSLDEEMVMVMAEAFKRTVDVSLAKSSEDQLDELLDTHEETPEEQLASRPPIVAVLGHVDHGKTSLLDYIRKSRVAAGEAGGITQHIGAYQVKLPDGGVLTFLDTPGHEAFTAMRARGAKITDIVILVVAADDGVMPQTEEAIAHAKAAGVPIVVAINKIDKIDAQPEKARQGLSTVDLAPEEWGGSTGMIEVSAITGQGVPELLERVALEAELLDLKAAPERPAEGYVVEARKQTGRGVVATMLVKDGSLNRSDLVLSGACQGKIKSLIDSFGKQVQMAGPSMPVEVTGLDDVPEAGSRFQVVRDKDLAKKVASERSHRQREIDIASKATTSREKLMDRIGSADVREVRVVLKADVKGSIEALRAKLEQIGNEEVKVKILHAAVGGITESDVLLAQASDATILGFHIVADAKARSAAEQAHVPIRMYTIIYELLDDMKLAAEGMLPTETEEVIIGHAEIRQLFKHRKRNIGGSMVIDGVARKNARVRLSRDGRVLINNGELESLRRFKDDAKEVKEGFDCGLMIAGFDDIKAGDVVEFYILEERKRTL